MRILESRLGRWMSMDPTIKSYESPYVSFANSPIYLLDPEGKNFVIVNLTRIGNNSMIEKVTTSFLKTVLYKVTFIWLEMVKLVSLNRL